MLDCTGWFQYSSKLTCNLNLEIVFRARARTQPHPILDCSSKMASKSKDSSRPPLPLPPGVMPSESRQNIEDLLKKTAISEDKNEILKEVHVESVHSNSYTFKQLI